MCWRLISLLADRRHCFLAKFDKADTANHHWQLRHLLEPLSEFRHSLAEAGIETELEGRNETREQVNVSEGQSFASDPVFTSKKCVQHLARLFELLHGNQVSLRVHELTVNRGFNRFHLRNDGG